MLAKMIELCCWILSWNGICCWISDVDCIVEMEEVMFDCIVEMEEHEWLLLDVWNIVDELMEACYWFICISFALWGRKLCDRALKAHRGRWNLWALELELKAQEKNEFYGSLRLKCLWRLRRMLRRLRRVTLFSPERWELWEFMYGGDPREKMSKLGHCRVHIDIETLFCICGVLWNVVK